MTVAKRISPGSILTGGLCLAVAAFMLWAVQTTALDRGPLHRHAREVLAGSPVRDAMATRVATGIMNGPGSVHGTRGPIALDPALVTQAVRAAATTEPQLAAQLAASAPIVVVVPDGDVPDLAQWADLLRAAMHAISFFAVLTITYALLRIDHRFRAIGRIGRWAIVSGGSTLVLFQLVPRALLHRLGGWIAVGGAVAGAGESLVPISLALIVTGGIAVFAAHRWELHDRQQLLSVIPRAPTRSTNGPGPWQSPV
jgi:hypothetical protein